MYKEHCTFIINDSLNLPFWRYMDFWKFLKLIDSSMIFFPNVEMMGDQHEGKIPKEIYQKMLENDKYLGRTNNQAQILKEHIEKLRRDTLILSWNANETESFALWKMYAKEKLGIAIKTNFERLKSSFKDTPENIYIGEVSYYDPRNPQFRTDNIY